MKTLKESLLDDIDTQIEDQSALYMDWIKENYEVKGNLKYHNGAVDVDGDIYIGDKHSNITSLTNGQFKFGKVTGYFNCAGCDITSLEGAPKKVGEDFKCFLCKKLESLKGCPKEVGGEFDCSHCSELITLEGAPKEVGGDFNCRGCFNLKSLKGTPQKVRGDFDCSKCKSLTSLKGAPKEVGGKFDCSYCSELITLEGSPIKVGSHYFCESCDNLKSLKGAPKKLYYIYCASCPKLKIDLNDIPYINPDKIQQSI